MNGPSSGGRQKKKVGATVFLLCSHLQPNENLSFSLFLSCPLRRSFFHLQECCLIRLARRAGLGFIIIIISCSFQFHGKIYSLSFPKLRFSDSLHAHSEIQCFSPCSYWDSVILSMPILGFTNLSCAVLRFGDSLHVLLLRFGDSLHDHTEIQWVIWSWKGFRIWMVWRNGGCIFLTLQGH